MFAYADNAATTKISNEALAEMNSVYSEFFGNPSSLHTPGQRAAKSCGRQEKKLPPTSVQSRERYILPRAAVRQIIRQSKKGLPC